jgi:hypothetical protein
MLGLSLLLATGVACSGSDLGSGDAMADANGIGTVDGDGPPRQDAAPPPPTTSYLRLAQLAPEVGTVDVCYRTKGAQGFTGPLLVAVAPSADAGALEGGALDAGAPGVSFGTVSPWVPIDVAGALDVALVPAGDTNCSAPRVLGQVTVDTGKRVTLVAMGTTKGADAGARALGIESFVDDATPHAQTTRVRVIHAALGTTNAPAWGPISVSVAYGNQVDPIAALVQPRHASTPSNAPPIVDALGYNERAPVAVSGALRFAYGPDAGANLGPWSTKPVDLGLAPSTVFTTFLLSLDQDLGVLVCNDLPSSGSASCQLLLRAK